MPPFTLNENQLIAILATILHAGLVSEAVSIENAVTQARAILHEAQQAPKPEKVRSDITLVSSMPAAMK
jgi:hypothetical protein